LSLGSFCYWEFAALSEAPRPHLHWAVFRITQPPGDEWSALLTHVSCTCEQGSPMSGGVDVRGVFFGVAKP